MQWKCRVLTTGPPGKAHLVFVMPTVQLLLVHSILNSTSTFCFHSRLTAEHQVTYQKEYVEGKRVCWVPMYVKQLFLPSHLLGSLTGCEILG